MLKLPTPFIARFEIDKKLDYRYVSMKGAGYEMLKPVTHIFTEDARQILPDIGSVKIRMYGSGFQFSPKNAIE